MSKSVSAVAQQKGMIFTFFIGYEVCRSRPYVCELTLEAVMMVMMVGSSDSEDGAEDGGDSGEDGGTDGGKDGASNIVNHRRTEVTALGNKIPRIRRNAKEAPSTVDIARAVKGQKVHDEIQGPRKQRRTRAQQEN